ncbi:MAG: dihydrofolate reductase family protein [Haliscomenobacter sp.]|nr:dihydrofolate reductase family protein [Haliscomenobacter sp.]
MAGKSGHQPEYRTSRIPEPFSGRDSYAIHSFIKKAVHRLATRVTCVSIDPEKEELIPAVLAQLASRNIGIVLAEGGAQTLNSFIRLGLWDEAWVFQSKTAFIQDGLPAPRIPVPCAREETLGADRLLYYRNRIPA